MIRERERREAGNHAFGRPDAGLAEGHQVGSPVALGVVPAKSVERDEDDIMRFLRGLGVGAAISMDKRQSRVNILCGSEPEAWRESQEQRQKEPETAPAGSKKHQHAHASA